MRSFTTVVAGLGLASGSLLTACSDTDFQTDLRPEGPPEILQVFVVEAGEVDPQLAYGSHPEIADDDGEVVNAVARTGQKIRVVFDELMRGNFLEEVQCNDQAGTYDQIPVGADPDDLANCAGEVETLVNTCELDICTTSEGQVGIFDDNGDGAPDEFRFIEGAATITCDGVEMPLDLEQTFYQPSGNQLITAGPSGVNSLGPAVILVPEEGLRTGATCEIAFADNVVDKDGERPCAGDPCQPGDLSGISWTVEGLRLIGSNPQDGQTNVNVPAAGGDSTIIAQFNAAIDAATIGDITVEDEGGAFAACADMNDTDCVSLVINTNDPTQVSITVRGGFTPNNEHVVTLPTTLADIHGGTLPSENTVTFTTGDAPVMIDAAPMVDAGVDPDAGDAG